ncbi:hypothetical protein Psi01_02360 [Planobispora siamensis]|uniref:Uncharacterized protein n=1 Tax=Planobispora siamensis TaxID=936338 RepID=A0A8J3S7A3_9ACTN|nr:hypothetical protein Psi01_02360 [Planobispora siamensis]
MSATWPTEYSGACSSSKGRRTMVTLFPGAGRRDLPNRSRRNADGAGARTAAPTPSRLRQTLIDFWPDDF